MNSLYIVVKETYDYWDDYKCNIEVFSAKEDALYYFSLLRDNIARNAAIDNEIINNNNANNIIIEEVIQELIRQEEENNGVYVTNNEEYFSVDIEEWGYNKVYIEKKEIMKCDIN